jgi:tetratricopeptide (TPR) repeat protein
VVLWCAVVLCPVPSMAMREAEEGALEAINQGEALLDRWQAEEAYQWVNRQLASEPDHPQWRFLLGQAEFYRGHYQQALTAFDRALEVSPHPRFQAYRDFVAQTVTSTASLQLIETAHFRIYLDAQQDAALVPYVGEVLEQSYQRLGEIFDWFPREKVRVEIFPTPATFYPATSLSARDIEVSGAIGICKFNKIMLLSPRNLARGYRWSDALSHEYIHYLLVFLSANRAPIWLHEGIAKYFEDTWRLPQSSWLSRRMESLLANALTHNTFVGFKNMEPSLVKLDTTYQVQLGYAEAASAIDFIISRLGPAGLVRILRDLQQSQDDSATGAIARVMGLEFDQFEAQWRAFLLAKQLREHEGVRLPSFQLKEEGKLAADELRQEIQSSTARMHARLGDRLRQRGRGSAAAEEYRRALGQDPYSPYLLNKLAAILMAQGHWQDARQYLQQVQILAPDYVTTYTNLGHLHVALQEYEQARQALWEAVQINPFDPTIHFQLAESYRQLGMADKAQQEHQLFQRLQEKP